MVIVPTFGFATGHAAPVGMAARFIATDDELGTDDDRSLGSGS
jgi:hypothetical protein